MEILELKNKNTKKKYIDDRRKKSIKLKIESQRLLNLSNKEKTQQKKKLKLRDLWSSLKRSNIYAIGVRENGNRHSTENIFEEIMTKISNWLNA